MSHCAGIIGHDKAILKWICFCFDSRAVGCSNVYLVKRDKIFCGLQRVASLIYPLFKKIRTVTIVNNIFDTFWEIPKWKQQQFLVSNSHMSDPRTLIFALKNNYIQWVIVMMFIVNSCRLIHAGKFRHWNDNAELILGLSCFLEAFQHDSISHLKTNPCCKKRVSLKMTFCTIFDTLASGKFGVHFRQSVQENLRLLDILLGLRKHIII